MKRFVLRLLGALVITAVVGFAFAVIPSVPTSEKEYEISDAAGLGRAPGRRQRDRPRNAPLRLHRQLHGRLSRLPAERERPGDRCDRERERPGLSARRQHRAGLVRPAGQLRNREFAGNGYRIVWHYDQEGGTRTFDLVYRVVNAATIHNDVVDVSWTVWGDQWDFWLNDLDAEISAQSDVAPEQAWLRPRSLGAEVEVGDAATVSVDRVPEGENVGFRAVFPATRSAAPAAPRSNTTRGCRRSRMKRPPSMTVMDSSTS